MSQSKKQRRRWQAEDKLRIVLAGMEPGVEISELCRRERIRPTLYHAGKKTLQGSASQVFNNQPRKTPVQRGRL